ncbi:MAG: hypothetical protein E7543_00495 [Ruminococcaceae bacterium]|nr:hypothetical protein [Oscillospiraceae bacterium]
MTDKIRKIIPVGYKPEKELWISASVISIAVVRALLYFLSYYTAYNNLFHDYGGKKILLEGAAMPDFCSIIADGTFDVFKIAIFIFLAMIGMNYSYHYRDSKSIYTMKRLPDKYELHVRCIALPAIAITTCIFLSFILLMLFYAHYMTVTPDGLILPAQWEKLWDYLVYGGKIYA